MIRKAAQIVILLVVVATAMFPNRASSSSSRESAEAGPAEAHRWVRSPLIVSFSNSLSSPPSNIKDGSDVTGALRRALQSWAAVADIQFFETATSAEAVSSANAGDGVNLITVSTANASIFESSDAPARTRVFYDSAGTIVEADIALNPAARFSTDGTPGTYDLESAFAHEVGHLLGVTHSAVIGATMQPRQTRNGTYGVTAFSQRTLSEDDAAQARALYGPGGGSISGRLTTNLSGRARSIVGAQFFAEDVATGRVAASGVSSSTGQYRIDGLRAGVYRVFAQPLDGPITVFDLDASRNSFTETTPLFRSFVASSSTPSQSLNVNSNSSRKLGFFVLPATPALTPRLIGMNGELCTVPLPLTPGRTVTIYLAGEGVDELGPEGISFSSSLIRIVPESIREAAFDVPYPVISFEVTVDEGILAGEYTIRLQSGKGELAFLAGAITIDK